MTSTGILQDVLPTLLHNHSAKTGQGGKFRHPREHPELNIHCRYFNQQTTIDSNRRGARSNRLKPNVICFCFLSIDYSSPLTQSSTRVYTVHGFKVNHLHTADFDLYLIHSTGSFSPVILLFILFSLTLLNYDNVIPSTLVNPIRSKQSLTKSRRLPPDISTAALRHADWLVQKQIRHI